MKPTGLNSRDSWLATMACTCISFLVMMPAKLSGLLFVEILGRYDSNRAMASYPLFLSILIRCSGGPLTGYCGERFGLYAVTLSGTVLAAVGVGICFVAEDVVTLSVFLGLVYGFGMAFATTLFPQVLKQHFDKNLTLAISLSMFGSCFGGFISPPLIKWIFLTYGVSGTFLIMGGIMLNAFPAAMLLKYLKPKKKVDLKESKPLLKGVEEPAAATTTTVNVSKNVLKNGESVTQKSINEKEVYNVWELRDNSNNKMMSSLPPGEADDKIPQPKNFTSINNGFQNNSMHFKNSVIQDKDKETLQQAVTLLPKSVEISPVSPEKKISTETKSVDKKPVSKQKAALQSLTIFLDFTFLNMLITQSSTVILQVLTLTTMLDYSRDKGIDKSYEVYFLMSLPLAEVIGRVTLSMIIDRNYITRLHFTILSFNVLAASVLVIAWSKSFAVMVVGVVAFGLVTSGLLSVFPMLVFQFIEPKNYIMALASKASLYGPMSFLCSPLIGYFRGSGGSYDWVYYIQAIISVLCALLTMFIPHCQRRRERRKEKRREEAKLNSSIHA